MQSLDKRTYPSAAEVLIEVDAAELTLDYLEIVGFINPLVVRDSSELAQWPDRPLAETLRQQVPHIDSFVPFEFLPLILSSDSTCGPRPCVSD